MTPNQSGAIAFISTVGELTIRSGVPIFHARSSANVAGGGMSDKSPRGAPLSTHAAIVASSASLHDISSLKCCMPTFFSMYQGGITPGLSRGCVRSLSARAYARTASYEISDIGATDPGWWHDWQLRCRIGATSLVKVCAAAGIAASVRTAAAATDRRSMREL